MFKRKNAEKINFKHKRCPECFAILKLDATACIECNTKVGKVDHVGLAKRPFNWKAYLAFILASALFAAYIWKVFF
ncbi:MAG: hypothetical protein KJ737_25555 [Proteobacteria bacterium]|nr:hypothetical protein [Pseudomonadota bacterium]